MFIVYPTNIDYLIEDVRLRVGDVDSERFSDSLIRAALISSVKFLQSKWQRRYQVYKDNMLVAPQPTTTPSGYIYVALPDGYNYIPSGLVENDVFRNPFVTFNDVSTSVIVQQDEYPIVLGALLFLRESILSANQQTFINWSDGEYSYSNVASANIMNKLSATALDELNAFFKTRRAATVRTDFTNIV